MSTSQNAPLNPFPIARDMHVAIVRTLWNSHITEKLMASAIETFGKNGIENDMIDTFEVPGAVELTFAAAKLVDTGAGLRYSRRHTPFRLRMPERNPG